MRITLFLLIVFTVACTSGERTKPFNEVIYEFDNFKTTPPIIEQLDISEEERIELVQQVSNYYTFYTQSDFFMEKMPLKERFSFLELNNDGVPDILYQGPSGGEADIVCFHLSTDTGYTQGSCFFQNLKELTIKDNKILALRMLDFGCCAEYVEKDITFNLNENFEAKVTRVYARISQSTPITQPNERLIEPIRFETINDNYKLRGEPIIDDTSTFNYEYFEMGNTTCRVPLGTRGKAWFVDHSDPERDWWYVELEPIDDSLSFDMFYGIEDRSVYHRCGWMSAKYLKKL